MMEMIMAYSAKSRYMSGSCPLRLASDKATQIPASIPSPMMIP